ncbi:DNA-binding protein [Candidatus Micrarchaeota archaeon]|nr:DNA-binding protein [Candidatus Micrarchaeota archaeon]
MKINDLKEGNFDSITGKVVSKEEPRQVTTKYGKQLTVSSAILQDSSGEVKLSLWNDDVDKVKEGDTVTITNGWASTFKDELQISLGKNGQMVVE